jgi:6-phosphogluconolactonase/glucosamine-6-phosphate isomerase/deaminase
MQYIKLEDYKKGSKDLADAIASELNQGKKVLWFLTGGSSIPSCVETLNILKDTNTDLKMITVTLTDERYGEVGHADSSWKKLIDQGFDFEAVNAIPVLAGKDFEETSEAFEIAMIKAFAENDVIISQFGIGSDLHIAGILPDSPATVETKLVSHYTTETFNRITLSFEGIRKIQKAFIFIFGESKKSVISELKESVEPLSKKPANILKEIQDVFVYSDQLLA